MTPRAFDVLMREAANGEQGAILDLRDAAKTGRLTGYQLDELERLLEQLALDDTADDWRAGLLQPEFWLDYDPKEPPEGTD